MWDPSLIFRRKNWRPFLLITLVHSGVSLIISVFRSCKKFVAPFVGPLFVGAPVRPNMLNMPKSAAASDIMCGFALHVKLLLPNS